MPDEATAVRRAARIKSIAPPPIDSRARRVAMFSERLAVRKSFYVALPPGYNSAAGEEARYPVLYLFRGHEREWVHRKEDMSRHNRTVIDVYRALLEAGRVGPMILVFPGISSDDNRVPGLLTNFIAPELCRGVAGIGTGHFEDYFVDELVPYVDSHFRTVANRGGRAVDGFSLGGFQSVKIAARFPHLFSSAGAFDGTFLYSTDHGRGVRVRDRVLNNPLLDPAFGRPRDLEHIAANSPANLLATGEWSDLAGVQWLLRSGPEEAEPWASNYYRNQHVLEIMRRRRLENGVPAVFEGATHNWHWADQHIADTLPRHWQVLSPAASNAQA